MTTDVDRRRRAVRMTLLYPRSWRDRYGDEFVELMVADMAERPRSARRSVDLVRCAVRARAEAVGMVGGADGGERSRSAVATLSLAAVVFMPAGVAVWSQLAIGWRWSAPGAATRAGMLLMTGALAGFAVWAALALAPLAGAIVWRLARSPRDRSLSLPAGVATLAVGVLIAGSLHFGRGWPGTGGHVWHGREPIPAPVGRFCWAATLWVTSYWAHPAALALFPPGQLVWMVLGPVAAVVAVAGFWRAVAALAPGERLLAYEARLGVIAAIAMTVFAGGAASWIVSGTAGPAHLFAVGAIDVVAVLLMVITATVAARAVAALERPPGGPAPAS
jgi:hypothetical protein